MANNKDKLKTDFINRRNKSSSVNSAPKRNIPPTGTKTLFDTADNTAKQVEAENTEEAKVESQPTPEIAPKKPTKTTGTTSKKKKNNNSKNQTHPC